MSPYALFAIVAVALAAVAGALLVWLLGVHWYVAWIGAWSVATFVLYGLDKRQARAGDLRVPEIVLHGMALIGGALGGWAGMFVFRHKTQHPVFYVVLGVATVLQLAVGWWLFR
jgi:uncharacterized membrane protein YsdA (DUF1294 family)